MTSWLLRILIPVIRSLAFIFVLDVESVGIQIRKQLCCDNFH
jgi:hypothetical protein